MLKLRHHVTTHVSQKASLIIGWSKEGITFTLWSNGRKKSRFTSSSISTLLISFSHFQHFITITKIWKQLFLPSFMCIYIIYLLLICPFLQSSVQHWSKGKKMLLAIDTMLQNVPIIKTLPFLLAISSKYTVKLIITTFLFFYFYKTNQKYFQL